MRAGRAARARPAKVSATLRAPVTSASEPIRDGCRVGEDHGVRVEQRQQPPKSPLARGSRKASTTSRSPGSGTAVRLLHPPAAAAGQLAGGGGGAPDDRGDLLERHREHVVQHERQPLGRRQRLEYDEQRAAHRVGQLGLELGMAGLVDVPAASSTSANESSRRLDRDRSMSRQTRLTTVVSQPPRLSMPSVRCSRSQASCTASSASCGRAEHPVGDRTQPVAVRSKSSPTGPVAHGHILASRRSEDDGRCVVCGSADRCNAGFMPLSALPGGH